MTMGNSVYLLVLTVLYIFKRLIFATNTFEVMRVQPSCVDLNSTPYPFRSSQRDAHSFVSSYVASFRRPSAPSKDGSSDSSTHQDPKSLHVVRILTAPSTIHTTLTLLNWRTPPPSVIPPVLCSKHAQFQRNAAELMLNCTQ